MVAARHRPGRGRSGLRRAGCWLTASRGDSQESATENRPPMAPGLPGAQVRVKRCGKSAPAPGATRTARQTPPGARPSVGRSARPMSPGRPRRWMATQAPKGAGQNPAYRPAHRHPRQRLDASDGGGEHRRVGRVAVTPRWSTHSGLLAKAVAPAGSTPAGSGRGSPFRRTVIDKGHLVRYIAQLEERGLVRRGTDAQDRRRRQITFVIQGRAMIEEPRRCRLSEYGTAGPFRILRGLPIMRRTEPHTEGAGRVDPCSP